MWTCKFVFILNIAAVSRYFTIWPIYSPKTDLSRECNYTATAVYISSTLRQYASFDLVYWWKRSSFSVQSLFSNSKKGPSPWNFVFFPNIISLWEMCAIGPNDRLKTDSVLGRTYVHPSFVTSSQSVQAWSSLEQFTKRTITFQIMA